MLVKDMSLPRLLRCSLPSCYARLECANKAVDSWGSATYAHRGSEKKRRKKKTRGAADSITERTTSVSEATQNTSS